MGHKYKDKYTFTKDIYKSIKSVLYKNIDYSLYYNIIKKFFEILIRDVVERERKVYLPNQMGYVYLDEKPHKRAFHYRVDINESNKKGKLVKYKVPILDDYYYKIVWKRPKKYSKCKIMPLGNFKKQINKLKTT